MHPRTPTDQPETEPYLPTREPCTCSPTLPVCPACRAWGRTQGKREVPLSVAVIRGDVQDRLAEVEAQLRDDPDAQAKGAPRRNQLLKSRAHLQRRLKILGSTSDR
jgi:hypothetical protein